MPNKNILPLRGKLLRNLSNFFLFVAFIFTVVFGFFSWQKLSRERLAFDIVPEVASQNREFMFEGEDYPDTLSIPEFALSLPIIPSKVTAGHWETTSNGVSYLSSSALPGEAGNSVLYGHNWASILGDLPNIKKGYRINVIYKSGLVKAFRVVDINEVTPDKTHLLDESKEPRLTLYTCSGFLDQKRFVVTADLATL